MFFSYLVVYNIHLNKSQFLNDIIIQEVTILWGKKTSQKSAMDLINSVELYGFSWLVSFQNIPFY